MTKTKQELKARTEPTRNPVRLLICDDQLLVRSRVREILRHVSTIRVIGEACDGRTAVRLASELKPDIILMDVSMPDLNGIEATRQIVTDVPGIAVLGYSADSGERTVRQMLAAGARGYLSKTGDPAELITALTKALAGEEFVGVQPTNGTYWPRRD
jgi:LuxR family maltose regulon positive regulatory protein